MFWAEEQPVQSPQEVRERQAVEIKEGGGPVGEGPAEGALNFILSEQDPVHVSKMSSGLPAEGGRLRDSPGICCAALPWIRPLAGDLSPGLKANSPLSTAPTRQAISLAVCFGAV